jgi:hypothetical protein
MKQVLLIAALSLALSGCGDADQDKLSDDLAASERGVAPGDEVSLNYAEDVNQVAAASAAKPSSQVDSSDEMEVAEPADPLAPIDTPTPTADVRPSFDCGMASTDAEQWICDDPDLAALDRTMSANYRRALARADAARASLLRKTGQSFLRDRNRCPDPDCVEQAYRWRLREIADILGR